MCFSELRSKVQSSLDIPGFSGETKNARYIEGHGISRDPFSGAKFQSKSLLIFIFSCLLLIGWFWAFVRGMYVT